MKTNDNLYNSIASFVLFGHNIFTKYREEYIMTVSTSELRENLNKYITLSRTEDIYITKHGEVVAKLVNPNQERIKMAESLFGILPEGTETDIKKIREERILEKWKPI